MQGNEHGRTWVKVVIGVAVAAVLVVVVAPWIYFTFIQDDPPPKLTVESRISTTTGGGSDDPADASDNASVDGEWSVADGTVVRYRIKETLFGQSGEAVGEAKGVTGSVTIDGTTATKAAFTVDMETFGSDESLRDNQFDGRVMEIDQFPTATFELTEPIDFGSVPAVGKKITASATGDITLHGVTKSVTFDVEAVRSSASEIDISGEIPVVFSDYGIDDPSGGPASVGDDGTLEFLLVLSK